jgi:hypothetical protein
MNEEIEVHWHPYTFHYHKPMLLERTKKIKIKKTWMKNMKFLGTPTPFTTTKQIQVRNFFHTPTKKFKKKQGAWSKLPIASHHVLSQKENKKWVKSSNLPTPYATTKKPNIKTIKTNKQVWKA